MNVSMFNHELVFGTSLNQNRRDRLLYRQSLMTHAMTFTGNSLTQSNHAE